jgi:hypothetical protein
MTIMSTQNHKRYEELERRVALIERQLMRARARVLGLGVALAAALALIAVLTPRASAQAQAPQNPRTVTRFQAPVLFLNDQGQAVAEISDEKGRYGITVYGRRGGKLLLGTSGATDAGLVQSFEPGAKGDKMVAQFGPGGLQVEDGGDIVVKNTQGIVVATMGAAPGGPGYLSLGNAKGDEIVKAGATGSGDRGMVEALPTYGAPPTVIPRYIMGGRTR